MEFSLYNIFFFTILVDLHDISLPFHYILIHPTPFNIYVVYFRVASTDITQNCFLISVLIIELPWSCRVRCDRNSFIQLHTFCAGCILKLRSLSTGGSVGEYLRFIWSNWIIPIGGQPDGGFWSGTKIYFMFCNNTTKLTKQVTPMSFKTQTIWP
jgi:hypothetical protein